MGPQQRPSNIDLVCFVELASVYIDGATIVGVGGGVVDQNVERTEPGNRLFHYLDALLRLSDVADPPVDLTGEPRELPYRLFAFVGLAGSDHYVGAGLKETAGDPHADPG